MNQFHADMLQMRNSLARFCGLMVVGFIGLVASILFKDLLFGQSSTSNRTPDGFPPCKTPCCRGWYRQRYRSEVQRSRYPASE